MSKTNFAIARAEWRKRQQSRAMVRLCINEFLDKLPQVYTPELFLAKCEAVYQHVYDNYGAVGLRNGGPDD